MGLPHGLSLVEKVEELLSGFSRRSHATKHAAGDSHGPCLLDTSHDHAHMAGLHDNGNALRLEDFGDG